MTPWHCQDEQNKKSYIPRMCMTRDRRNLSQNSNQIVQLFNMKTHQCIFRQGPGWQTWPFNVGHWKFFPERNHTLGSSVASTDWNIPRDNLDTSCENGRSLHSNITKNQPTDEKIRLANKLETNHRRQELYSKNHCTGPLMIPTCKWSPDWKWSPNWTANDPRTGNDPQTEPQMIPRLEMIPKLNCKWSPDGKWSPNWTANDPLYRPANDPDPQMIPRPEMIPKLNCKWSPDGKWSPCWATNDPWSPHHKYRMEFGQWI